MTSPGLLLLLLALSSLPVPSVAPPPNEGGPPEGQQATNPKPKSPTKQWFEEHFREVTEILADFFKVGPFAKAGLLFFPKADKLDSVYTEGKASYSKLDTVKAEVKWTDYQKAINDVEHAWIKYTDMVQKQQITGDKLKEVFLTFYDQYADSALVLYQYLTAEPVSITQTLGDLLADRLRCHEADVNQQFDNLNELMCKGNELDKRYYELKGLKPDVRIEPLKEIAKALLKSQKECISNIDHYIAMDVFDRIDDTKKHQVLADEIKEFLKSTYTRYDWMVVAFSTHNTKGLPIFRKYHILTGFIEIERGTVTVAVAKQLKGSNTKVTEMTGAIEKCFENKPLHTCNGVIELLQTCPGKFLEKPVPEIYTAVHIFRHSSQTSTDAEQLPVSGVSTSNAPLYMYKGECGKILGKLGKGTFMILIKSDEEIRGDDPCKKITCDNNAKCDKTAPMCECTFPFYGSKCDKNLDNYKKNLGVK